MLGKLLSLSVLICEMNIIIAPDSEICYEGYMSNTYKELS